MSRNPELDHYLVLGIERDASPAEIDDAYELAKTQGEIDLGDGGMGGARSADIEKAYRVLRDPEKRAAYDKTLD